MFTWPPNTIVPMLVHIRMFKSSKFLLMCNDSIAQSPNNACINRFPASSSVEATVFLALERKVRPSNIWVSKIIPLKKGVSTFLFECVLGRKDRKIFNIEEIGTKGVQEIKQYADGITKESGIESSVNSHQ